MYQSFILLFNDKLALVVHSVPCPREREKRSNCFDKMTYVNSEDTDQDPVVQSVISLMSSSRVISLTVLADSIYNILIFFAEKM